MRKIQVNSLSFSTVKQFTEGCSENVFLDKVDKAPRLGTSAAALLGSGIHSASESHFRALLINHKLDADVLLRVFENRWNAVNPDNIIYGKQDKEKIFTQAKDLISLLLEAEQPKEILAIEKPVTYQLTDDLAVIGKADLIYRNSQGRLVITDVKTSAKAYSDADLYNVTNQVYTYALAFSEPVKLKVMLFVKTKTPRLEEIELNADDIDFEEWKNRFIQTKRGIENNIRYKVRSWMCKSCSFSYLCNQKSNCVEIPIIERKAA
ncbi:MAG: PD-(D/E)XK nuclease family protein [Fibrobacteria bacterium]|nr:PD-(D/E)XK nuclease family protein [Fibrobacteria bacterium]